jgi:hypothetical protein
MTEIASIAHQGVKSVSERRSGEVAARIHIEALWCGCQYNNQSEKLTVEVQTKMVFETVYAA